MTREELDKAKEILDKLEAASFSNDEYTIVFARKKMSKLEAYIKLHVVLEFMGELGYEFDGAGFEKCTGINVEE